MATFKQQNVEDFYEIGEVLGRWVSFQGLYEAWTGASSEFHPPSGLAWVRVWLSAALRGTEPCVAGTLQQLACLCLKRGVLRCWGRLAVKAAERWTHSLWTACSPGPSRKEQMAAGCGEGDGSKLLIITRQGNLGGETLWRKLVGCNMDLRKLQIIFYTKGLERRVSEPLLRAHLMSVINWSCSAQLLWDSPTGETQTSFTDRCIYTAAGRSLWFFDKTGEKLAGWVLGHCWQI